MFRVSIKKSNKTVTAFLWSVKSSRRDVAASDWFPGTGVSGCDVAAGPWLVFSKLATLEMLPHTHRLTEYGIFHTD